MLETPFFKNTMPRDRFLQIMNYFHICDNGTADANDGLTKIRTFLELIMEKLKTNYIPTQDISTDESLLKFKGRLKFKQYNPQKRARFGIKLYKVCQSNVGLHVTPGT